MEAVHSPADRRDLEVPPRIDTDSGPATPSLPTPFRLRSALLILLYGGSLLLINLHGESRVLTFHEAVFCQPAREMLETGDWVIPRMLGVPDTEKPPLTAWMIASCMQLTGSQAEWAVRLPSVLWGLLTAVMIAATAARWFGDGVGLLAGLIQTTTYYTLSLARLAEADILLVATVCGAMCTFALAAVDSPRGRRDDRWLPWLFYLAAGLAFLTKGLIGPFFIFSATGLFMLVQRDWRLLRFFFNPVGLGVFAVCTLTWPILAIATYPPFLDDQIMHHVGRFKGELGTTYTPFFYLYIIPINTLPWTPLIVLGFILGWRSGWTRGPLGRFLLCWILPGLLLLSASRWRHYHYSAPLLPGLAIAGAVGLVGFARLREKAALTSQKWLILLTLAASAAGVALVLQKKPRGFEAIAGVIAAAGVLGAAGFLLELRRRATAQLAIVLGIAWALIGAVHLLVLPHFDSYRPQAQFAREIIAQCPPDAALHLVEYPLTQIVYYLPTTTVRSDKVEEFLKRATQERDLYVIARLSLKPQIETLGHVAGEKHTPYRHRFTPEGDRMTLFHVVPRSSRLALAAP